jgi:predicted nucleic acid-binding protein
MTPPSSWPDADVPIILDASAVINLNGSGAARPILGALRQEVVVAEDVVEELARGAANGRRDAELLEDLIAQGVITRRALRASSLALFESLTVGPSATTLEDGEAATIALALEIGGAAVIDESKGRRLAAQYAPGVPLIASIEVFCHPLVQAALGAALADTVFGALQQSRMQVLASHHAWIAALLGSKRLRLCLSLPRSVRQR